MLAAVNTHYGPPEVVQITDIATPVPGKPEVLIRVHATTVTSADANIRGFKNMPTGFWLLSRLAFGLFRPRNPVRGLEFSGEIAGLGEGVSKFALADPVFGMAGMRAGCHAEFLCLPESAAMALKPESLSHAEAAAIGFGGTTALDFLRKKAQIKKGEAVLVIGASGCVGSAAVQLAKHFGAQVTGVCSGANVDRVASIGADYVIDYEKQDFTSSDARYDLIVDTVGGASFARCKGVLAQNGRLLLLVAGLPQFAQMLWVRLTGGGKRIIAGIAIERADDLRFLAALVEAGDFDPVIGAQFAFNDIVQAHAYADSGRKVGSAVVIVRASEAGAD